VSAVGDRAAVHGGPASRPWWRRRHATTNVASASAPHRRRVPERAPLARRRRSRRRRAPVRRVDLLAHGATRTPPDADVSVAGCRDARGVLRAARPSRTSARNSPSATRSGAPDEGDAPHHLEPLFATPATTRHLERFIVALDCRPTVKPLLERLAAPMLVVWGTGDVFFDVRWASGSATRSRHAPSGRARRREAVPSAASVRTRWPPRSGSIGMRAEGMTAAPVSARAAASVRWLERLAHGRFEVTPIAPRAVLR
jgi:hypothetical protein